MLNLDTLFDVDDGVEDSLKDRINRIEQLVLKAELESTGKKYIMTMLELS